MGWRGKLISKGVVEGAVVSRVVLLLCRRCQLLIDTIAQASPLVCQVVVVKLGDSQERYDSLIFLFQSLEKCKFKLQCGDVGPFLKGVLGIIGTRGL